MRSPANDERVKPNSLNFFDNLSVRFLANNYVLSFWADFIFLCILSKSWIVWRVWNCGHNVLSARSPLTNRHLIAFELKKKKWSEPKTRHMNATCDMHNRINLLIYGAIECAISSVAHICKRPSSSSQVFVTIVLLWFWHFGMRDKFVDIAWVIIIVKMCGMSTTEWSQPFSLLWFIYSNSYPTNRLWNYSRKSVYLYKCW